MYGTILWYNDSMRALLPSEETLVGGNIERIFSAEFDTLQEALAYVDELEAKYQACDKLTFIIDDLTFPEEDALYLKQINEQESAE